MLTEQDIKNINEASGKLVVFYRTTAGEYIENYEGAIAEQMHLDGTYPINISYNEDLMCHVDAEHIK